MSVDITKIPMSELMHDLNESLDDIYICADAIRQGIATYSYGVTKQRLDDNRMFVERITNEIHRRASKE